jgi:hypothetical protein
MDVPDLGICMREEVFVVEQESHRVNPSIFARLMQQERASPGHFLRLAWSGSAKLQEHTKNISAPVGSGLKKRVLVV